LVIGHYADAVVKQPNSGRTPLTADDIAMIQGFGRVTFQPGSWDKRFATDMAVLLQQRRLITDGQRANVQRMAHKYRRQMPRRK
jgi:hypothetical protein